MSRMTPWGLSDEDPLNLELCHVEAQERRCHPQPLPALCEALSPAGRHPPRLPQDPRLLRGGAELTLIVMLSLVPPLKRVLSFFI
jgi:hypothetical protein